MAKKAIIKHGKDETILDLQSGIIDIYELELYLCDRNTDEYDFMSSRLCD